MKNKSLKRGLAVFLCALLVLMEVPVGSVLAPRTVYAETELTRAAGDNAVTAASGGAVTVLADAAFLVGSTTYTADQFKEALVASDAENPCKLLCDVTVTLTERMVLENCNPVLETSGFTLTINDTRSLGTETIWQLSGTMTLIGNGKEKTAVQYTASGTEKVLFAMDTFHVKNAVIDAGANEGVYGETVTLEECTIRGMGTYVVYTAGSWTVSGTTVIEGGWGIEANSFITSGTVTNQGTLLVKGSITDDDADARHLIKNAPGATLKTNCTVEVVCGANMSAGEKSGALSQTVFDAAIADIIVKAAPGYCFPKDYVGTIAGLTGGKVHGLTVTRTDEATLTISGTPDNNVNLTLPEAVDGSVSGVQLDQETLALLLDETVQLKVQVQPDYALNQAVTWSSDNEAVATVDATGLVTAKAAGSATITVTTEDFKDTCSVTVTKPDSDLTLSCDKAAYTYGDTVTLTATIQKKADAANVLTAEADTVEFLYGTTVLGTAEVTYDADGFAGTATLTVNTGNLAIGSNTITANYGGGDKLGASGSATCTVTVNKKELTITGAALQEKTYDGTVDGTVADVTLDGFAYDETLGFGTDYTAVAEYDSAAAGTDKTVTVTVTLNDTDVAGHYELTTATYTLTGQTIAAGVQNAPAVPTVAGHTKDSITLAEVAVNANGAKAEYRVNNGAWQESPVFGGLADGTTYTFEARYAAVDGKYSASEASEALTTKIPHAFGTAWEKDENNHWHECACGQASGVAEHGYTSEVTTGPTCTEAGERTHTCTGCGYTYTEAVAALGHSFTKYVYNNDATTDADGTETAQCDREGCTVTDTRTAEGTKLPKPEPTPTLTPEPTPSPIPTPTPVPTPTPRPPRPTYAPPRPTEAPEPTVIPVPTATPVPEPTATPVPTATPAPTPVPVPQIKGEDGKTGWDAIAEEIKTAEPGDTVVVDMNGTATVPGGVMESIAGKDVTIVFDIGNSMSWSVNGTTVTAEKIADINFAVTTGTKNIPVDIINNLTGERYSVTVSLAYEGEFGFTAVLRVKLDKKNVGLYANLFYYNAKTKTPEFVCADEIDADGNAEFKFTHASDYMIVIDKAPMVVEEKYETYTVKRGDTLWAISRKYGTTVKIIWDLNREKIKNPDMIGLGWKLKVPVK